MVDADRGLTSAEVAEREARGQVNLVPRTHTRTVAQIVRANVFTRFNALLGAMLAIILVVGPFQDALFGFVLVANAGVGIVQELRAKRTLDRLTRAHRAQGTRRPRRPGPRDSRGSGRAGRRAGPVERAGRSSSTVRCSTPTGSSSTSRSSAAKPDAGRRSSPAIEALSGSFVAAGSGAWSRRRWAPTRTPSKLAVGGADGSRSRARSSATGIDQILRWVTCAIVPTAALLFVSQLRHHDSWRRAVSGAVAGTVAMVPEGLVLLMSVAFAVAVMRLAKRQRARAGAAGRRGAGARRRPVHRQDRNAHRRQLAVVAVEPLDGETIGSSRRSRRSRPPTHIPTRPWPRSRERSPTAPTAGRRRPRCRSPPRGSGAPSRSRIGARGSSAAPTC